MVKRKAVNRDVVGSSPTRGVFLNIRLRGQAVKTLASHAGIRGSIPLGVTEIISGKSFYYKGFLLFYLSEII